MGRGPLQLGFKGFTTKIFNRKASTLFDAQI
jgi:hypothetical protein